MATTTLLLDTRNGEDDTPYKNKFGIEFPTLNNIGHYSVSLQAVEFPNTVYPINSYYSRIYFSEDAGVTTLVVQLAFKEYTGTTFAAAIETAMNAVGADVYTVTYDDDVGSKKLTFASTGTFRFVSGAFNMYDEMGVELTDVDEATKISDYPINISGTQYVDLITNLSTHNHNVGRNQHVMTRIPLQQPFGTIVFYQPRYADPQYVSAPMLDEIFIELRDAKGNLFELPNNAHVSIQLMITQIVSDKTPDVMNFSQQPQHAALATNPLAGATAHGTMTVPGGFTDTSGNEIYDINEWKWLTGGDKTSSTF